MEILGGALVVLVPAGSYLGGKKLLKLFKYKKVKRAIYKEIEEAFKEDKNLKKMYDSLKKLRDFDLDEKLGGITKKLEKKLELLGLPEDSLDNIVKFAKYIDERKDKVLDKILEEPKLVSMVDTKIDMGINKILNDTKKEREAIDKLNLTNKIEELRKSLKEDTNRLIKMELKKNDPELIRTEEKMQKDILKKKFMRKMTKSNRLSKIKVSKSIATEDINLN